MTEYEVRDLGFAIKRFKVSKDIIQHKYHRTELNEWKLRSTTNPSVIHTVNRESRHEFRCSCQDFKINQNPNCKHIRFVKSLEDTQ